MLLHALTVETASYPLSTLAFIVGMLLLAWAPGGRKR